MEIAMMSGVPHIIGTENIADVTGRSESTIRRDPERFGAVMVWDGAYSGSRVMPAPELDLDADPQRLVEGIAYRIGPGIYKVEVGRGVAWVWTKEGNTTVIRRVD